MQLLSNNKLNTFTRTAIRCPPRHHRHTPQSPNQARPHLTPGQACDRRCNINSTPLTHFTSLSRKITCGKPPTWATFTTFRTHIKPRGIAHINTRTIQHFLRQLRRHCQASAVIAQRFLEATRPLLRLQRLTRPHGKRLVEDARLKMLSATRPNAKIHVAVKRSDSRILTRQSTPCPDSCSISKRFGRGLQLNIRVRPSPPYLRSSPPNGGR